MRLVSIDEFINGLAAIPQASFVPERVSGYVADRQIQPESLGPYMFFSRSHYTRNLVFKNEMFEAVAVGWEVGQASMIHNHREQNCWMAVPIGRLKNQNYRVVRRDPGSRHCELMPTSSFLIAPTSPLRVDPEEPVHQVLNLAEFSARAVSIHIYSRPFDSCEVYSLEKQSYWDVPLGYTSEYGRLCADERGEIECPDRVGP